MIYASSGNLGNVGDLIKASDRILSGQRGAGTGQLVELAAEEFIVSLDADMEVMIESDGPFPATLPNLPPSTAAK